MTDSLIKPLLEPLSDASACGEDLEDTQLLASFDAYRLFGQPTPLPADTPWRDIKDASLAALQQSKDLRLLAHLAAAVLRSDGLPAFYACLNAARHWLDEYWAQVYPLVDDDAILRKNALNAFADRMAIVDGLRRMPLVAHRQLGAVSLRDLDIATGQQSVAEGDDSDTLNEAQIAAVFAAAGSDELTQMHADVSKALESLHAIEERMREQDGSQSVPTFDALSTPLRRIQTLLQDRLGQLQPAADAPPSNESGEASAAANGANAPAAFVPGAIRTRRDALRCLDLVATFFRENEPSSPIPLLIERSKRLVDKDFLEVLADIAPDALGQARAAGGIREDSDY